MDDGTGKTKCARRLKYAQAAKRGDRNAQVVLDGPELLPHQLALWNLWAEFAAGRAPGFDHPRVTWEGLEAWMRLSGERLSWADIEIFFVLDNVKPAEFREGDD